MPNNNLVQLRSFRLQNRLTQATVAKYLGVTHGFISLVENNDSKLPIKAIDKLFASRKEKGWKVEELVPAYTRLVLVTQLLLDRYGPEEDPWDMETELCRLLELKEETLEQIRHGVIGITANIAWQITNKVPEISVEWLLNGNGQMVPPPQPISRQEFKLIIDKLNLLVERYEVLSEAVDALSKQGDRIESKIEIISNTVDKHFHLDEKELDFLANFAKELRSISSRIEGLERKLDLNADVNNT